MLSSNYAEFALRAVLIGAGATVVMDLWAVLLQRLFRVQPSNWAMVGGGLGTFRVGSSSTTESRMPRPSVLSWRLAGSSTTHRHKYGALLLGILGLGWARRPTLLPPLILSLVALVAPFFLLQPGMGFGVAGATTPNPNATRVRSALNHTVFGLGLYVSALLCAQG